MKRIGGYAIIETLFASKRTCVYRGQHPSTQERVVIKVCESEYPALAELAEYRNHFTLTRDLALPGIVRALRLEPYRHGYALFLEDFGAIALASYWQNLVKRSPDAPGLLPLSDFFSIALQLVELLEALQRHRIVHRDINPTNILINPETKEVWLTDFSIASCLPRQIQTLCSPNTLRGTLAYLSPEQTGRMNRGIDYRSDFYALGVTWFELLTGQRPFSSCDPMELVHCHIAVQPPLAHHLNAEIPQLLSALVGKLLAKNPENRYQSALGLKHDLQICWRQWREGHQAPVFELGQHDVSEHFAIPEQLYGRGPEVAQLLAAFDRISQGSRELVLVAGHSGIGKTAVINEVHKPIVQRRGYFLRGKFEQFQRDVPLLGLIQALNDLINQLLSESDIAIASWRSHIKTVLGSRGQVILEVLPQLEQIIGPQPAAPELFGTAAQKRFNQLLKAFIQVFTQAEHPLVLCLDDLQWADSASLQFLEEWLKDPETHHLLVIGAYRNNEVEASHPLTLLLPELSSIVEMQTLELRPLHFTHLNQLIADSLHCSSAIATPLTELVLQKTQGSPFFVTQFLQVLYDRELLTYNPQGGYWQFDIAQVKTLATTADVVELLLQRLRQLPVGAQHVISLAACLGNQFDLQTLALACDQSVWRTAVDLWQALREGLILPISEVYKFFQGDELEADAASVLPLLQEAPVIQYRFLHDRVQQAAYSLIPEAHRPVTHLLIGRRWLTRLTQSEQESQIFELVRHLNLGRTASASILPHQMARLNWRAAVRARTSAAYESAAYYCQTAQTYLGDRCWHEQYTLTFDIAFEALHVAYLMGRYCEAETQAQQILQSLERIAKKQSMATKGSYSTGATTTDQNIQPLVIRPKALQDAAKVYDFLVKFYSAQNRMEDAVSAGLQGLRLLKIKLVPDAPLAAVKAQIVLPAIAQVPELPSLTDPVQQLGLQLLMNLCTPGFATDPKLYRRIVLTMLNCCQQYGYAAPAAHAYVSYGMSLCGEAAEFDLGYQAGQLGLCLVEQFDAKALKVKANLIVNGQIHHWKRHLSQTISGLEGGIYAGIEVQDLEFATYCLNFLCLHTCRISTDLETTLAYQAKFFQLNYIKTFETGTPLYYARIWHQFLLSLTTISPRATRSEHFLLQGSAFDEVTALPHLQQQQARVSLAALYVAKTLLACIFAVYDEAVNAAAIASQYLSGLTSTLVPLHNAYQSLALLALQPYKLDLTLLADEAAANWAQVNQNQQQLQKWAEAAPMNYGHLYQLVEAERYRVLGQPVEAMAAYDTAIAQAEANQYLGDMALAYERAAGFYHQWGKPIIVQTYGTNAYYAYARWGAQAKVCWMEQHQADQLRLMLSSTAIACDLGSRPEAEAPRFHTASDRLDLRTLMQASRILSREIQVEKLLAALLKVIRQNAGAEKCVLMLAQSGKLLVKAHAPNQECQFLHQTVESFANLPSSLINYVFHTQQTVLSNAAATEPRFATDPYILQHQPKSILCSPLLNQGKLIGLVYLENALTAHVFSEQRLEVIELLCAQAAVSLEIAGLYEHEQQQQQELREKNLALERAIAETKAAKGEIVRLNQNLERRIQQRTAELEATNRNLQEQIAERQQVQQRLQDSELQFASILSGLEEVVWSISARTGKVLYLNPAAQQVYGRSLESLCADPDAWKKAVHPEDIAAVEWQFSTLFEKGELHCEYRILKPDGEVRWLTNYARVIYDDANQPVRIDCTLSDITDRKRAEEQLIYEALHDQLTGLPNRTLIMDRTEMALQRLKRHPAYNFALLFIDFDRFKVINDSLGHLVGDHLLIFCAQTLKSCLRPQDTIARLGGDEFVILLEHIDDIATAIQLARRIQARFQGEIKIDGHTIFTSASIGIVLGAESYSQASELLRDADIAMYRAKANGRSRYEVFTPTMRAQAMEALHAGNALRLALERDQLQLYYQPILSLATQQVVGLEALLRWHHPKLGLLLPDSFIPSAMENGLMVPLGLWVLRVACVQMRAWQQRFPYCGQLKINLNVSDHLISRPDFLDQLETIFQETELSPQSLCIELVEATLMSKHETVSQILQQIRQRQMGLAIDDFGTGYSSLSYLHQFPINYLKIDRSFIHQMNENAESLEIIRTIVTLAHTLGKGVVAEGIEHPEQVQQLRELGCHYGQGFYFSPPLPADAIATLLQKGLTWPKSV